jgi:ribosome-dependent ATPase
MRSRRTELAIEIPPGISGAIWLRGRPVQIGVWVDGAMPQRAETTRGYVQGMHADTGCPSKGRARRWRARWRRPGPSRRAFATTRTFKSLVAMVPAVIPLLLMLIPAMLTALSVVREKELGSIINFYVTPAPGWNSCSASSCPTSRWRMLSFPAAGVAGGLRVRRAAQGQLPDAGAGRCSTSPRHRLRPADFTFMRSQIAALFGTAVLTILPAVQFSGLIDPVSSLEGAGIIDRHVFPTTIS